MQIIPAVDIRQGKCVRLTQGKIDQETIYSNDPVFCAKMWSAKGARRIHLIDLDGAFCGIPQNLEIIESIRRDTTCVLEFGGGVRNSKTVKRLIDMGIDRVILGTVVVYNPEEFNAIADKYAEKIMVGIDINEGRVAIGGWKEVTEIDPDEVIKRVEQSKIREIIVTDIKKDGTLEGPSIELIKDVAKLSGKGVIASGGIGTLEDVKKLKKLEKFGVTGMIIGKALYSEAVKFVDAVAIANAE